jgi:GTP cyclohydrolase IA
MSAELTLPTLRAVGRPAVDVDAAARAVQDLMSALGMDLGDPSLQRTPERVARAYAEMLAPREFGLTTFPNDEQYDELVVARDIPFTSLCEHHLLPFVRRCRSG